MSTGLRDAAYARMRRWNRRVLIWTRHHVPPGLRLIMGILLICGGILGFLPVLGFWMLPLGVLVASLDVVPLWRWLTGRPRR